MTRPGPTLGLVAALLCGCDRAPGDGLEPFPSDGVAGFGKPDLVEVCIGTARAVPGGAAAVCVPAAATPRVCAADAQCQGTERCLCGRCIVQACGAGTVCPSGEACRAGRCTTACTTDGECPGGGLCDGGGCTRGCDADGDCHHGEVCGFSGTCAAEACGPAVSCGAGHACEPLALDGEVREPTFATVAGEDLVFFELRSKSGAAVYRARIDGPAHLTADPTTPVLAPPPGEARAGAPSAVVHDDRIDLFVAIGDGAALGLAVSDDGGRSFSWTSDHLLVPQETWENGAVGSPAALSRDGATLVFYEGGPGRGIGLAKLDGASLSRLSATPVLVPADLEDASFWRSVQSISDPFALVSGDIVRVYVTARGIEAGTAVTASGPVPAEPNESIGLFAGKDPAFLDRFPTGPIFATTAGLFGSLGEREPAVRLTAGGAELYFVATDASGAVPVGLSRAATAR